MSAKKGESSGSEGGGADMTAAAVRAQKAEAKTLQKAAAKQQQEEKKQKQEEAKKQKQEEQKRKKEEQKQQKKKKEGGSGDKDKSKNSSSNNNNNAGDAAKKEQAETQPLSTGDSGASSNNSNSSSNSGAAAAAGSPPSPTRGSVVLEAKKRWSQLDNDAASVSSAASSSSPSSSPSVAADRRKSNSSALAAAGEQSLGKRGSQAKAMITLTTPDSGGGAEADGLHPTVTLMQASATNMALTPPQGLALLGKSGSHVMKYCSGRANPHRKHLKIDKDAAIVHWKSPKKKRNVTRIRISEVKELRRGQKTEIFLRKQKKEKMALDKLSFSVIYGPNYKTLDVVCMSEYERDLWVSGLTFLMERQGSGHDLLVFLRQVWDAAEVPPDGEMSFDKIIKVLKKLNVRQEKKRFRKSLKTFDTEGKKKLNFEQFKEFFLELRFRPEIKEIYASMCKASWASVNAADFRMWLEKEQGAVYEDNEYEEMMKPFLNSAQQLDLEGFSSFMESDHNSIVSKDHKKVCQDMSQPMSHYFINSSHNTYLLGDQLTGKSSAEAYIRALQAGCRCVELDCWDGPDGQPIIYHGHTFTSKIPFRDVIEAINAYAFVASPYPVILSIENHCGLTQQQTMAKIMTDIFKDHLCTSIVDSKIYGKQLPSPEQLKYKILIKGKRLPEHDEDALDDDDSSDEENEAPAEKSTKEKEPGTPLSATSETSSASIKDGKRKSSSVKKKNTKLAEELSKLVIYCQAAHFKSFEHSVTDARAEQMSSFGEAKSQKFIEQSPHEYIQYNRKQLSRIYPAGGRVDSSNYDPTPHWAYGCQIVALNFQTLEKPMYLNTGKFLENGKSGYVLKPGYLRSDSLRKKKSQCLVLKVINGQQFPKPKNSEKGEIIDPFVEIEILGAPQDYAKVKTKTVQDNGFNPKWDEEFTFNITDPELALIRFVVMDEDINNDDFIASFTLPLNIVGQGFRRVPLLDDGGQLLRVSSVFVNVSVREL